MLYHTLSKKDFTKIIASTLRYHTNTLTLCHTLSKKVLQKLSQVHYDTTQIHLGFVIHI